MIELLAVQIHKNEKIEGLKLKNQELLLVQFPDDLGLVLQYKQRCWDENLYVFDCFQRMSGMLINYDKSVVYIVGTVMPNFIQIANFSGIKSPLKF